MYIKEIKDMINLMNENGLTELEIEKEGVRIRLKKGQGGLYEKSVEFTPLPTAQQARQDMASEKAERKNTIEIKAPMVGTFYRAASPEAPPHVNIGDMI